MAIVVKGCRDLRPAEGRSTVTRSAVSVLGGLRPSVAMPDLTANGDSVVRLGVTEPCVG